MNEEVCLKKVPNDTDSLVAQKAYIPTNSIQQEPNEGAGANLIH